ncbi:MAG: hypothetical protein ACOC8I_03675 [Desulfosalsimonas sp.]
MSKQKKTIIIIGCLAVVFIFFMIFGIYPGSNSRRTINEDEAASYRDNKWAKRLEKPISMFTPELSPNDFYSASTFQDKCKFSISSDHDTAFRSLNLSMDTLPGAAGPAGCEVSYQVEEPAVDNLKNQSDTLEGKTNTTTIIVQKGGGNLELRLKKGTKISMKHGSSATMLCERSTNGTVSINSGLGR